MKVPYLLQRLIDPLFQKSYCKKYGVGSFYYIFPYYLNKESIIYSGGGGENISFENELTKEYGSKIYLFDPTPTIEKAIGNRPHKNIQFIKCALSGKTGKIKMIYPKEKSAEGSFRAKSCGDQEFKCISLVDFMKEKGHKKIDFLKLDIEGAEYDVLNDLLDHKIPISQISVELHHRFKDIGIKKTILLLQRLRNQGYKLIYKHIDDYTFIKKELLK